MEMEMESSGGEWSRLPTNALNKIIEKLISDIADLGRFRSVCSTWRTATVSLFKIPWLMLPCPDPLDDFTTISFFLLSSSSFSFPGLFPGSRPCSPSSLARNNYFRLHLPDLTRYAVCQGLSHQPGWILLITRGIPHSHDFDRDYNGNAFLFNPITNKYFGLPPLPLPSHITGNPCPPRTSGDDDESGDDDDDGASGNRGLVMCADGNLCNYSDPHPPPLPVPSSYVSSVSLAALSSPPSSSSNFEVMVIRGWDLSLACYQSVKGEWTPVVYKDSGKPCTSCTALAYYKGQFYVIDADHDNLVVCDTSSAQATVVSTLPKHSQWNDQWNDNEPLHFLVTSDMGLLLLFMRTDRIYFEIYWMYDQGKWTSVSSIGKQAIFICQQNSLAISIKGSADCSSDCIYYSDISKEKPFLAENSGKLMEFNLKNRNLKIINCSPPRPLAFWPSFWFYPTVA